MPDLPSHASPMWAPRPADASQRVPRFDLNPDTFPGSSSDELSHAQYLPPSGSHRELLRSVDDDAHMKSPSPPPNLLSPAFTPPATPGTSTPAAQREPTSIPVDSSASTDPPPKLLPTLPIVHCVVRAHIPTTTGAEMWLHLYQNNVDNKEHLAIVFGSSIRSTSLFREVPGETEQARITRGAYEGRLYPGRTSSRLDEWLAYLRQLPQSQQQQYQRQSQEQIGGDDSSAKKAPLVRIHSECYTGETVWSARCDCGEQLDEAARLMSLPTSAGGVIVYLRQEGRGIGLGEKLKAYNLQDLGSDTVEANLLLRHPADARSYGLATSILVDLGLSGPEGIRLLTNNPDKIRAVEGPNREIVVKERVAMIPLAWKTHGKMGIQSQEIENYLRTKIGKMGHMIN